MERHNKKVIGFNIIEVIVIIIISALTSMIATGIITTGNSRTSSGDTYAELLQDDSIKSFLDVYSDVVNGYYKDVDKNKAVESAISGMMQYLGDKYTTYLNDAESSNLTSSLSGTYKGIGIAIKEGAIIEEVFDNSPAKEVGLQKDDKIIAINDENVENKPLIDITSKIKTSNSKIKLTVLRGNETLDVEVLVKELNKPVISSKTLDYNNSKVGYIYIQTFSSTVHEQVRQSLNKLEQENISGLIIDLRDNGGGYLTAAEDIASQFIEKGKKIYSLETKDEIREIKDETDEKKYYNVVVLTNEGTASASEILASALKESYGAKIVGKKTFGKGKVQQVKNLSDGTMVKYTTAKWLTPSGNCVDGSGITPDVEIDIEKNEGQITNDTQLERAMEVLFE